MNLWDIVAQLSELYASKSKIVLNRVPFGVSRAYGLRIEVSREAATALPLNPLTKISFRAISSPAQDSNNRNGLLNVAKLQNLFANGTMPN